jgi:uncharacterized protein YkwD
LIHEHRRYSVLNFPKMQYKYRCFYILFYAPLVCFLAFASGCASISPRPYNEVLTPPYLTPAVQSTYPVTIAATPTSPSAGALFTRTPSNAPTSPRVVSNPTLQPPNLDELRIHMLDLINRDRAAAGLGSVQIDGLATQVAQAHAEEMATHLYMSHWNLQGLGPDLRYSIAGGRDAVMENVFRSWRRFTNGTPVPVDNWGQIIADAEASLMASPGHRANILTPEHTHVGIGIAYNSATGDVRVAQEFVNHFVILDPMPQSAKPAESMIVAGQLLPGVTDPLINLAYESSPRAMSVTELNATSTFQSPAKFVTEITPQADTAGKFKASVAFEQNYPAGVYHVRIWVTWRTAKILAVDRIVFFGVSVPNETR